MEGALKKTNSDVQLRVNVNPGQNKTQITGYNEWRQRIRIDVKEPPEKGKANKELINYLQNILSVNKNDISITKGHRQNKKTIKIRDIEPNQIIEKLKKK
ncbi:hypothetical protein AMET1_0131 [Methanonatronarchaeum thermophilum]|uniref:UPF0235 protein AMET1_0131 n=1 Tax=Methanonatronarchaeum thermophilum TaxID=1927129 RepID=A0A1Y3GDC9_9EURY|nr:DUF167 domain-containing protein [Methanonatronarchaeum thermophilum]OUJ19461.1 hypothetical protein AMET1_0131 [Methanonatronarchaeum thermophilum]